MRIGRLLTLTVVSVTAALAAGCGPSCQSSCNRLYQDVGSGGCGIESAGTTQSELVTMCLDACSDALDKTGDIGDYNPYERTPSNISVDLENDRQAAIWMECVAETSCEYLDDGYCEPVW